jgi:hypothetical protein
VNQLTFTAAVFNAPNPPVGGEKGNTKILIKEWLICYRKMQRLIKIKASKVPLGI